MCHYGSITGGDDSRACVDINNNERCSHVSDEDEAGVHYCHDCEDDTLKSEHVCSEEESIIDNRHWTKTDCLTTINNHVSNKNNNFLISFLAYLFIFIPILNILQLVHMPPAFYKDLWLHIFKQDVKDLCNNDSNPDVRDIQEKLKISGEKSGNRKRKRVKENIQLIKSIKGPSCSWYIEPSQKHETKNRIPYRQRECYSIKPSTEEEMYKALKSTGIFELQERYISDSHPNVFPVFTSLNAYLTRVRNEGSVPQDEEMCYEVRRFKSFSTVPVRASPMRLAQSGFNATGRGDETRCYSCRMTYSEWRMMDQPDVIHRSISPDCPHLNRGDQRNVPILSSASEVATTVCGVIGSYPVTNDSSEASALPASSPPLSRPPAQTITTSMVTTSVTPSESTPSGSTDLPGLDISRAVYPQYRDLSSRLDSYQGWGWSHIQDPQVLSRAGFYYAGYRDCVRCFYCGVGLRTWEREDDPWVEHVRWTSSCDYVRLMRGEQFAIQALANQDPPVPMASRQHSENTQPRAQNVQLAVSGHGTNAVTKAEQMGFERDHIERAVVELTGSQSAIATRDTISLETLLEKLVLMSEQPVTTSPTTSSSLPTIHNSYTEFSIPNTQPMSLAIPTQQGSKGGSHMGSPSTVTSSSINSLTAASVSVTSSLNPTTESLTGASVTVTSSEHPATHSSVSSGFPSVTNQKMVEPGDTEASGESEVLSTSQEQQLEEENQSLRDESTCKICMDNPSCIVFLPCGHLVTCAECAPSLRKCPICRALIRGTVRVHTVSSENVNM